MLICTGFYSPLQLSRVKVCLGLVNYQTMAPCECYRDQAHLYLNSLSTSYSKGSNQSTMTRGIWEEKQNSLWQGHGLFAVPILPVRLRFRDLEKRLQFHRFRIIKTRPAHLSPVWIELDCCVSICKPIVGVCGGCSHANCRFCKEDWEKRVTQVPLDYPNVFAQGFESVSWEGRMMDCT